MHAVGEFEFVEVDQKPDRNIEELHIAEELRLVDGQDLRHSLDLHQYRIINEKVEPENFFPNESFVFDGHLFLRGAGKPSEFEFLRQAPFIDRLDKARTLVSMHLDRSRDDVFG